MKNKFKKNHEIIWGLDFWSLTKISFSLLILIFLSNSLKTSIDSPLFVFFLIIVSIIIAFIIKAAREDEINGYYSAFILHPLKELIYLGQENQLYKPISSLNKISKISNEYLITPEKDLIAVIKIVEGFCINRASKSDIDCIFAEWRNILSEMHKNNILDSYFFTSSCQESIQYFIDINNYQFPHLHTNPNSDININFASNMHQDWYKELSEHKIFMPDPQIYLIIKQKNPLKYKAPIAYRINTLLNKEIEIDEVNQEEQNKLIKQKIASIKSFLERLKIKSEIIQEEDLQRFRQKYLLSEQNNSYIKDHGKFLENNFLDYKYSKTYRLTDIPEKQNFWIKEFYKRLKTRAHISIHIETRNSQEDRFKAHAKFKYLSKSKFKNIDDSEIYKKAFVNLSKTPYSFDFSLLITIFANDIKELIEFDREIKKPFEDIEISSLDRMQIKNFTTALATANNLLNDKEKIFCHIDSLSPSFPLIDKQLGTGSGPLLGRALEDERPIFFDEYNRDHFHNRGINFIGDSGSGKTVAAKLNIKRRLSDSQKSFYIIDNTDDGWEFFVNYYSGQKIDIDTSTSSENKLFSPLFFCQDSNINEQVDKCLELFKLLQSGNQVLDYDEKVFFSESLKELYRRNNAVDLSDLLLHIRNKGSSQELIIDKWSKIFYPYCKITNGIYSGLLDNKESQINNRLTLFTFSKINSNRDYHNASMFLITDFISSQVTKQSQTTLIIDEAWKLLKNNKNQAGAELICHLARAGRGLDLGLWTISQKPSDIPAEIHSSASATLCFQLKERQDRQDMIQYANLNTQEEEFINSIHLTRSGNAFLKTTKDSGLIRLELDPVEHILTSSVREFSNLRKKIFQKNLETTNCRTQSALNTVQELLKETLKTEVDHPMFRNGFRKI
jgi:hypothetical protein